MYRLKYVKSGDVPRVGHTAARIARACRSDVADGVLPPNGCRTAGRLSPRSPSLAFQYIPIVSWLNRQREGSAPSSSSVIMEVAATLQRIIYTNQSDVKYTQRRGYRAGDPCGSLISATSTGGAPVNAAWQSRGQAGRGWSGSRKDDKGRRATSGSAIVDADLARSRAGSARSASVRRGEPRWRTAAGCAWEAIDIAFRPASSRWLAA